MRWKILIVPQCPHEHKFKIETEKLSLEYGTTISQGRMCMKSYGFFYTLPRETIQLNCVESVLDNNCIFYFKIRTDKRGKYSLTCNNLKM